MGASLAALALLALGGGQDSAHLVDDLIARTNGLKSFVASYRIHGRTKDAERREYEGRLRLAYRASEDLLIEFASEDVRMRSVIAGGTLSVRIEKAGRPHQHGDADLEACLVPERARIASVFHEQFPALGDIGKSPGPGLFVRFTWKPGTDSSRPEASIQAGTGRGEGPLLDWLGQLRRSTTTPATEGEAVVWEPAEGLRIFIQEKTGFIEKIVATYQGETKTFQELEHLALDTEVGDEEFLVPEIDPSAQDISESLGRSLGTGQLAAMRALIHRKIREATAADELEWNGDSRASFAKVSRALHREFAPVLAAPTVEEARFRIDRFTLWYQESRKGVPEGDVARSDEIETKRTEWERLFRGSVEEFVTEYLTRVLPESTETDPPAIAGEARGLELEAAEAAYRELVAEPLIERFDDRMERARRAELPPATK